MEQNRIVDFDSTVEIDSLKDAVWRLTTRVYLLEDFIAERFGEVISSNGFAKQATESPSPGTSGINSTTNDSISRDISSSSVAGRKWKKRDNTEICEMDGRSDKIQKTNENTENTEIYSVENIAILGLGAEQIGNECNLIPKDELILSSHEYGDTNDCFLNERSDDKDDSNDSLEKDPDFNPTHFLVSDGSKYGERKGRGHGSPNKNKIITQSKADTEDRHLHNKERRFACTICGRGFTRSTHLKDHLRTHSGEKPYRCEICGNTFTRRSSLNIHLLIHTGEKPFKCTLCKKCFKVPSKLSQHMKTHK